MGVTGINPGKLVTISAGGQRFTVSATVADRMLGLLNDLTAAGITVAGAGAGGYNDRWIQTPKGPKVGSPSNHARGTAIDIAPALNAQGTRGSIDPNIVRRLAAKWGLRWGGDFSTPDPMHFEYVGGGQTGGTVGTAQRKQTIAGPPAPGKTQPAGSRSVAASMTTGVPNPTVGISPAPQGIRMIPVSVNIPTMSWEEAQQLLGPAPSGNLDADELTRAALTLAERPVDFPDPMQTYRQLELLNQSRMERARALNQEQLTQAQQGSDEISAAISAAGKGFGADATLAALAPTGRQYMQTAANQAMTRIQAAAEDDLFRAASELFNTDLRTRGDYASRMPENRINALKAYTDIAKANLDADTKSYQEQSQTLRTMISDWGQTGRTTATETGARMRANQTVEKQLQQQDFSTNLELLRQQGVIDAKTYQDQLTRQSRIDQETWKMYQLYSGLTGGDQQAARAMAAKAAPALADTKAAVSNFRPLTDAEEQSAGPQDFVNSLAFKTFYNPRTINGIAVSEDRKVGYNDATTLITQRARALAEAEFVAQGRKPSGEAIRSTSTKAGEKFYTTSDVARRAGELQKVMIAQYNNLTGQGLDETARAQIEAMWRTVPVATGIRGRNTSGAQATPANLPGRPPSTAPLIMGTPTNRAPAVFTPGGSNRPDPATVAADMQRILGGAR